MPAKKKGKAAVVINVYDYRYDDLPKALQQLGDLQREREAAVALYDEKISRLQAELAEKTELMDREIKKISQSVKHFMDENRPKYLSESRKTLSLSTGDISYRNGKPSVKTKNSDKLIGSILESNSLTKIRDTFVKKMSMVFLRTKLELDKDAILANPITAKNVTGVEIENGAERFYLKPYSSSTELEVI